MNHKKLEKFLDTLRNAIIFNDMPLEGNLRLFPEANEPEVSLYVQWNGDSKNPIKMKIEYDYGKEY